MKKIKKSIQTKGFIFIFYSSNGSSGCLNQLFDFIFKESSSNTSLFKDFTKGLNKNDIIKIVYLFDDVL